MGITANPDEHRRPQVTRPEVFITNQEGDHRSHLREVIVG